ncbi:MAG: bifunctional hydroxymethylpyrimidine kinase/phosphomethylpyrimidine kinase [Candidatus Cloacimonetes bacterium]|nr:bifunctional hydroxymethylpyrimidine kinase/phosphomethylpyrimidine kinase [Candidatus Cloacimonadota bacterium]
MTYQTIISRFASKKIAVFGDVILDKFVYGKVERISPEAPVPVVQVEEEKYMPGGAANVAANIKSLGGYPYLFGITGEDYYRDILLQACGKLGIDTGGVLADKKKMTTLKTRIIGLNQQLLRIDHEDTAYIESHQEKDFLRILADLQVDAIVVSDYAKGSITSELLTELKAYVTRQKIKIIIDPKPKHRDWYRGVTLITPNQKEAGIMSGITIEKVADFLQAGRYLQEKLQTEIILTAGSRGIYVFPLGEEPVAIPTRAREVYDVSGAGDTVAAAITLASCSGASLVEAADIANHAAGIKVGKLGTVPVFVDELIYELNDKKS